MGVIGWIGMFACFFYIPFFLLLVLVVHQAVGKELIGYCVQLFQLK